MNKKHYSIVFGHVSVTERNSAVRTGNRQRGCIPSPFVESRWKKNKPLYLLAIYLPGYDY